MSFIIQAPNPKFDEIYYDEPRLKMTAGGRVLVRVISNAAIGLAASAALVCSLSDVGELRALGFLIILFLADQAIRFGKPEKTLVKIPEGRFNVADYLAPSSYRVIEAAYERAAVHGEDFTLHLLRELVDRKEIKTGLSRMDIQVKEFAAKIEEYMAAGKPASRLEMLGEIERLAFSALNAAVRAQSAAIGFKDIFGAIVELKNENVVKLMRLFNLDDEDLESALIFSRFRGSILKPKRSGFIGKPFKTRHRVMNRSWTARPTPFLDQFSEDLTDRARSGEVGFMVGHEKEYEQLVDVLSRPGNPNAILVGEPSSGKNTVIGRLAFQIVKDRVPPPLFDRRLVSLALGSLSAGAKPGELQERVKKIIDEIARAGNIILYIPDIHNLVKSGAMEMSAADVLIPAIKGSAFSAIGATYPREFKQYIESASDFASAFEVIRVDEIGEADAVKFLAHESLVLEPEYGIVISFKAIKQAVQIAHKYFREKRLPASAEDLLKEALASAAQAKKGVLSPDAVVAVAERRINVPIHEVQADEAKKLLDLESLIHERMIDQEEAVTAVSSAIREYRSGLTRRGGPIASFLFVGPTGVGKTELAKILTQLQFGNQSLMLRFDMSEYQDKQSFFRFIGSPDGSVRGVLTDAVLEKPYSLILLDEFEKAHPDILNLFLQVFDDGRLTDNLGRTVDFQNTIIIATSNAHSEFIKTEIERSTPVPEIAERLKRKLTDFFKAELLNRFSSIIVFKPLSATDIKAIAKIQLKDLSALLRENQGIDLVFDDAATEQIASWGYDPVFGARPLRKVISDRIRSVLAEKILKKEISRGGTVRVGVQGEELTFNV